MAGPLSSNFCAPFQQALVQTAGIIGKDIYDQSLRYDDWTEFVKRVDYDLSEGTGQQYSVIGRSDTSIINWGTVPVTTAQGSNPMTSACEGPTQRVRLNGVQTRTPEFSFSRLVSDVLCLEDLRRSKNASQLVVAWIKGLKDFTRRNLSLRHQYNQFYGAGLKVIAMTGNNHVFQSNPYTTSGTYPATVATATASTALLTQIQEYANNNGADEAPFKTDSGAPIHLAFLGSEMLDTILRGNPRFREDLHYAYEGKGDQSPFLGPLGSVKQLRDTAFRVIKNPRRFSVNGGGVYTEIPYYSPTAVNLTIGQTNPINPQWMDPNVATHEEILIPYRENYYMDVPSSDLSLPGIMKYGPQNYMGEWRWVMAPMVCPPSDGSTSAQNIEFSNIDENKGFFTAKFEIGREFHYPERSIAIMVKRCGFQGSDTTCGSYSGS